jgi:hypothetical protein
MLILTLRLKETLELNIHRHPERLSPAEQYSLNVDFNNNFHDKNNVITAEDVASVLTLTTYGTVQLECLPLRRLA